MTETLKGIDHRLVPFFLIYVMGKDAFSLFNLA